MARKSRKSSASPLLIGGMILGLVVVLAVAVFLGSRSEPFSTTPALDIPAYLENANSLRGNTYRLRAEILNSLAFSPNSGRLISVVAEENKVLPLLLPAEFNQTNIQRGQEFFFELTVDDKGLLQVVRITKS